MTTMAADPTARTADDGADWFQPTLDAVPAPAQELFEGYAGLAAADVKSHIVEVRNRAWAVHYYPCLGRFNFLDFSISAAPQYEEVLQRVRAGEQLIDVGCCFGQDVRKLIFDGAPSANLYATDMSADFLDLGYDLFRDRASCKATFIAADIFSPASSLDPIDGTLDMVHASSFFHLFDRAAMTAAAVRVVRLLRPRPGSMVFGRQGGRSTSAGTNVRKWTPKENMASLEPFRHTADTLKTWWIEEVGPATGTKWTMDVTKDESSTRMATAMRSRDPTGEAVVLRFVARME